MPAPLDVTTLELPPRRDPRPEHSSLRLTIALHPDLRRIGETAVLSHWGEAARLHLSRLEPDFFSSQGRCTGPLADPYISRSPLVVSTSSAGVRIDPNGSRTRLRVDGRASSAASLDTAVLDRGVALTLGERVVLLLQRTARVDDKPPRYGLIGESAGIDQVRRQVATVAGFHLPVLIRGESGTGKELVARALHAASPRAARPHLSINVAALPEHVAIAELFGHARGSFTGAIQARDGYFRQADSGTIFLDEVGEASVEIQAALLRVLETGEVQPLGGAATRHVDVRVLAATDADLDTRIREGSFRAALYHRLAAFEITVPALRERREDIPRLFVHFLAKELALAERGALFDRIAGDSTEALAVEAMEWMLLNEWAGNVRELNNFTRRIAAAICAHDDIRSLIAQLDSAPERLANSMPGAASERAPRRSASLSDSALLAALEDHDWNIAATARALGISRSSLYARIRQTEALQIAKELTSERIAELHARHDGKIAAMAAEARVSVRALQLRIQALGLRP